MTGSGDDAVVTFARKLKTSYRAVAGGAAAAKKVSKSFKLKPVVKAVPEAGTATFKLKLSKKAEKGAKKALENDGKAKAKITAGIADAAGNLTSLKRTVKLKLKR